MLKQYDYEFLVVEIHLPFLCSFGYNFRIIDLLNPAKSASHKYVRIVEDVVHFYKI